MTNTNPNIIAIGALGGSGTRAVAQIFLEAGCFMGDELNESLDNLLFTRIFKNPEWFQSAKEKGITRRFGVFTKVMKHQRLNASELLVLRNAIKSNKTYPSDAAYLKQYTIKQLIKKRDVPTTQHWGWKEPNTQFFIDHFLSISPQLKYIHVLRHGLDMAFSSNKKQLHNWGFLFNLKAEEETTEDELTKLQLNFWIESTKRIQRLQAKFPGRVLILKMDELVHSPAEQVKDLLAYSGISVQKAKLEELVKIPAKQPTDGRYKNHDLTIFSKDQLDFVRNCGFEI